MKVIKFTVNPFAENTFLAWDEPSRETAIIDPGMMQEHELEVVTKYIEDNELLVRHVLLTHVHIDHVAAARWVADRCGVKVSASPADNALAQVLPQQAERFGLNVPMRPLTIDHELGDGDVIALGKEVIHVLAVPGHSPGGLVFYAPDSELCFTGDCIFQSSIGRTDLPGGSLETLLAGINDKILTLPGATVLLPGHGPNTTVRDERRYNPYVGIG